MKASRGALSHEVTLMPGPSTQQWSPGGPVKANSLAVAPAEKEVESAGASETVPTYAETATSIAPLVTASVHVDETQIESNDVPAGTVAETVKPVAPSVMEAPIY